MKKSVLLLLAVLLLVLTGPAPVGAQFFHRMGHANRSKTMKAEHSNKNVRHRDKQTKVKKRKPDNGEKKRHKQAKRDKINKEADALDREE